MRIVRTVEEMVSLGGGDIGFVPTMGALHEGHLSLIREARRNHPMLCVSIFLNPLQFGRNEDLVRYPRNEERDFELADREGVDLMFAPSYQEIYPGAHDPGLPGRREITTIHVPEVSELWEGQFRPGHFDGVATVVAKLFNIVQPMTAFFGWKDVQQCVVIGRMVDDLNMPVRLTFLETIREPDGLALSSRNVFLDMNERSRAPMLRATLLHLEEELREPRASVEAVLANARSELAGSGFDVDYLELVSLNSFRKAKGTSGSVLIVAARLGTTRLIDNLRLGGD